LRWVQLKRNGGREEEVEGLVVYCGDHGVFGLGRCLTDTTPYCNNHYYYHYYYYYYYYYYHQQILTVLLIGSAVIPMVQYWWYVKDGDE